MPNSRLAMLWLALVSGAGSLVVTVSLFDRVAPLDVTRLWALSLLLFWGLFFFWWVQPQIVAGHIRLAEYEPRALIVATLPLVAGCLGLVAAIYLSDSVHLAFYSHLYYRQLLADRSWPVFILPIVALVSVLGWLIRDIVLHLSKGWSGREAVCLALARLTRLLPVGVLLFGLLLSTATLSMINVNYWRYWATADGWLIGHYPFTLTDRLHVVEGGVAPFFISFPLLPAMLSALFPVIGHATLSCYLPLIAGNVLLALALFLTVREITRSPLLALLTSALTVSFPLLRRYTLDMAEADNLLMATVVFAAYWRVRANRDSSVTWVQTVAGFCAGLASLARAEGILYMGAMYLCSLPQHWRERGYWLSVGVWALVCSGFSAVMLRDYGMIWPGNHSGTLSLANFGRTLEVVREARLFSAYSSALGLDEWALTALLVVAMGLIGYGLLRMLAREPSLSYMPAAALGNVLMVFFVGPVPAEAAKFHDFFRHISFGFPLLAVTIAHGLYEMRGAVSGRLGAGLKLSAVALFSALVFVQLSMLHAPVDPAVPAARPIMTSDIHVLATELLIDRYELPVMRFKLVDGRYLPDEDLYMADFPDVLARHYKDRDVRLVGNAGEYYEAAAYVFVLLLAACLLASNWVKRLIVSRCAPSPADGR